MKLPPRGITRWTAGHKAAVVNALRSGTLSVAELCERYLLSEEELADWQATFERSGVAGLHLKTRPRRRLPRGDA
jgi:transposase-like protein